MGSIPIFIKRKERKAIVANLSAKDHYSIVFFALIWASILSSGVNVEPL